MSEKTIASIVHEAVTRFCHERAEKEQRGYAQAVWFEQDGLEQVQVMLENSFIEWLNRAYGLGYASDDVVVTPYISTHGTWYGWTSFRVEIPVYGSYGFDKIIFPQDSELLKAFIMPFLEREQKEAAEREAKRMAEEAAEKAVKEAREAERLAWIEAHGSDYLQRAVRLGYNCQRQYVTERAGLEFPDFQVDFDDKAEWRSRSCPSEEALVEVETLIEAGHNAEVVWLIPEPDPCEAIVVKEYLGKYNLVKTL